jgi:replication initiation and membrane attachment protein
MKEANPSDFYEVRPLSLFSSLDEKVVVDLYEPLIGAKAVAVFFTLLNEVSEKEALAKGKEFGSSRVANPKLHSDLYKKTQLSPGEWTAALIALEAVLLVQTYRSNDEKLAYYCYCLFCPKTPKDFFGDALFAGTLQKYVGEAKYEELVQKYNPGYSTPKDFENISEQFIDFFSPDFSDLSYAEAVRKSGGESTPVVQTYFDRNIFFQRLLAKDYRFNRFSLSEEELKKVQQLSALYSYDESTMADIVADHFDFKKPCGKRLDMNGFSKDCADNVKFAYLHSPTIGSQRVVVKGDTEFAQEIRKMERLTPVAFLCDRQGGNKPAKGDLLLLEELTSEMGLTNPACNALVYYLLKKHDNALFPRLAEKLGASLVREKIVTAIDALNYLDKDNIIKTKTSDSATTASADSNGEIPSSPDESGEDEKPMSDEDFKKMMDGIGKKKK